MINIAWYDIQTETDCITYTEWNEMATYIQHSACTDFTIYGTCPSTGQAFRFSRLGDDSFLYGGTTTEDDLFIYANDVDAYPYIKMLGDSVMGLYVKTTVELFNDGTQMFKFDKAGDDSKFYGGTTTADDLFIYANDADAFPYIKLLGDSSIAFYTSVDLAIDFFQANTRMFRFEFVGTQSQIFGSTTNGSDILIQANSGDGNGEIWLSTGTDVLRWGAEITNAGSDRGELIKMKTETGDIVYLKTYDTV